jgi:hypothetical protein
MGEVIQFPDHAASARGRYVDANSEPAMVIILPVVRIEREPDDFSDQSHSGSNSSRKRRRRMVR